jgi:hypothetical protein
LLGVRGRLAAVPPRPRQHLSRHEQSGAGGEDDEVGDDLGEDHLVDVEAALREHGIDAVKQMKLATLEADGSISIVATAAAEKSGIWRRRRRYHRPL